VGEWEEQKIEAKREGKQNEHLGVLGRTKHSFIITFLRAQLSQESWLRKAKPQ
jgi:hypothetical protein